MRIPNQSYPKVLIIAGSDSGGGAGIQADIKTVTVLGGYAMTAITALTAQNSKGVFGIHSVPEDFVQQQIEVVLGDMGAHAIKIGMLHRPEIVQAVASVLHEYPDIPPVLDPVMVAGNGDSLITSETVAAIVAHLIPRATIVTPNLPEASKLTGIAVRTQEDMEDAAYRILDMGCKAVLIKGGHLPESQAFLQDLLLVRGESKPRKFINPRISTQNTHGTGCTLASAIALYIALGYPVRPAVGAAIAYLQQAIKAGKNYQTGKGMGPVYHNFNLIY